MLSDNVLSSARTLNMKGWSKRVGLPKLVYSAIFLVDALVFAVYLSQGDGEHVRCAECMSLVRSDVLDSLHR